MPKIGAISNQQTMLWMKRRALDRNQPLKQLDPDFLAQMQEIFQLMDRDGSGEVDEAELISMLGWMYVESNPGAKAKNRLFHFIDTDHSGVISFKEFALAMQVAKARDYYELSTEQHGEHWTFLLGVMAANSRRLQILKQLNDGATTKATADETQERYKALFSVDHSSIHPEPDESRTRPQVTLSSLQAARRAKEASTAYTQRRLRSIVASTRGVTSRRLRRSASSALPSAAGGQKAGLAASILKRASKRHAVKPLGDGWTKLPRVRKGPAQMHAGRVPGKVHSYRAGHWEPGENAWKCLNNRSVKLEVKARLQAIATAKRGRRTQQQTASSASGRRRHHNNNSRRRRPQTTAKSSSAAAASRRQHSSS